MVNQSLVNFFYNRKNGWIDGTTHFVSLLKGYCKPGAVVMDLGAGSGEGKPDFYSLKGRAGVVVGLDIDPDIIKNAIIDSGVLANAYSLPFKQDSLI